MNIYCTFFIGDWSFVLTRSTGSTSTIRVDINLRESGFIPNIFLPRNTIPKHYDIDLITFLDPNFNFEGTISIDVTVSLDGKNDGIMTLNEMYLDVPEEAIRILDDTGYPLEITEHEYDLERELHTIKYVLPQGLTYDFKFQANFSGYLFGGQLGYCRYSYVERDTQETIYIAASQLADAHARWVFPCFDEPDLKATFDLKLGRQQNLMSLANVPAITKDEPIPNNPGYVWDTYQTSDKMSTYLVAFAVGTFQEVRADLIVDNKFFSVWGTPEKIQDGLGEYGQTIGRAVTQYYSDLFELPYPLPKLDYLAFPTKRKAMENFGLVISAEPAALIDISADSSVKDLEQMTFAMSHEICHQWSGDLITCKWWDDIWLNEGICNYVMVVGGDFLNPDLMYRERFIIYNLKSLMRSDSKPDSLPMLYTVNHPNETNYGEITYNKGSTLVRMIEHFITYDTLISGLSDYFKEFAYSNAVTDDLWLFLNQAAQRDGTLSPLYNLKTIMDPWMYLNNYPLLTVSRDYAAGTVTLSQARFLTEPDPGNPTEYEWYIPFTYTLLQNGVGNFEDTKSNIFLEPKAELTFPIGQSDEAIIFNLKHVGMYRVNYDAENWNRIIDVLNGPDFRNIDPINRAQILSDSYALAQSGNVTFDLTSRVARYLVNETDYVPLAMAFDIYTQIITNPGATGEELAIGAIIETVIQALYSSIGLDPIPDATQLDNFLQMDLTDAVKLNNLEPYVSDAIALFNTYKGNPSVNPVNRQVRLQVYCTGLTFGDATDVAFLENQRSQSINPQEIQTITRALDCAT